MLSHGCVGVPQRPAGPPLSHLVEELLGNPQMPQVVLDGHGVVLQEGIGVAQGVAGLSLNSAVAQVLKAAIRNR